MILGKQTKALTVGVLWGFRDEKELKLHNADLIVSSPSEILRIFEK